MQKQTASIELIGYYVSVLLIVAMSLFNQAAAGASIDEQGEALQQKLKLLDSIINKGATSKKLRSSDNLEARQLLKQAEELYALALANIDKGDFNATSDIINKAIRALTSASSKTKGTRDSTSAERTRYQELLDVIETLQENVDLTFENPVDLEQITKMKKEASVLTEQDDYRQANKILDSAYQVISTAISDNIRDKTVLYNLDFKDSKEEYAYEYRRYQGNRELVMTMLNQHEDSPTRKLIVRYTDLADSTLKRAQDIADNKHHDKALKVVEQANKDLARAMGMLGLRF